MSNTQIQLVTIIAESILTTKITDLAKSLGARGFTLTEVRGEGTLHRQSGESPEEKIKVEVICTQKVAGEILSKLKEKYFTDYSMIAYCMDVNVLRPEKFKDGSKV